MKNRSKFPSFGGVAKIRRIFDGVVYEVATNARISLNQFVHSWQYFSKSKTTKTSPQFSTIPSLLHKHPKSHYTKNPDSKFPNLHC